METNNEERERLIKELQKYHDIGGIADFIIADRARIVAPLVKMKNVNNHIKLSSLFELAQIQGNAISETLKLAGMLNG